MTERWTPEQYRERADQHYTEAQHRHFVPLEFAINSYDPEGYRDLLQWRADQRRERARA